MHQSFTKYVQKDWHWKSKRSIQYWSFFGKLTIYLLQINKRSYIVSIRVVILRFPQCGKRWQIALRMLFEDSIRIFQQKNVLTNLWHSLYINLGSNMNNLRAFQRLYKFKTTLKAILLRNILNIYFHTRKHRGEISVHNFINKIMHKNKQRCQNKMRFRL